MNIPTHPLGSPTICPAQSVIKDWIDYNGHLNMAYYHVIFDRGVDHVYDYLGNGEAYTQSGAGACFTMEVHVNYLNELSLGDNVQVHFQLLDHDAKRLHFVQQMYHVEQGYLAATAEHLCMHVDTTTRKSAPFPKDVLNKLAHLLEAHSKLDVPDEIGHRIGIKRK